MAKKASCRCKQAECEECPEWIFTFADLVMLMMGFFVILWVLKPNPNPPNKATGQSDSDNWIKVEASIREAFGYVPNPSSTDPVDMQMVLHKMAAMKIPLGPGQGGETTVRKQGATGSDPDVTSVRPSKTSIIGGRLLFDPGDARMSASISGMLDQVADQVRGHRNIVLVKGHASLDDLPDTATPSQKLSLSLQRAQAVADGLVARGVDPQLLRVQGCSTFEPVVQREYDQNSQTLNRRVEVEVMPTLVDDFTGTGRSQP